MEGRRRREHDAQGPQRIAGTPAGAMQALLSLGRRLPCLGDCASQIRLQPVSIWSPSVLKATAAGTAPPRSQRMTSTLPCHERACAAGDSVHTPAMAPKPPSSDRNAAGCAEGQRRRSALNPKPL